MLSEFPKILVDSAVNKPTSAQAWFQVQFAADMALMVRQLSLSFGLLALQTNMVRCMRYVHRSDTEEMSSVSVARAWLQNQSGSWMPVEQPPKSVCWKFKSAVEILGRFPA